MTLRVIKGRAAAAAVRKPLTEDEREGICLAVQSAFRKLRNLYEQINPIFQDYGFRPPSAGVVARDLSEKIEASIVQHCPSFSKSSKHCDLTRCGAEWEVKICKDSGLTINQSKQINGENYIVINYSAKGVLVRSIWVLWHAQDQFFSPRRKNANARAPERKAAAGHIEVIYEAPRKIKNT